MQHSWSCTMHRYIINVEFTTQHKGRDGIGPPHRKPICHIIHWYFYGVWCLEEENEGRMHRSICNLNLISCDCPFACYPIVTHWIPAWQVLERQALCLMLISCPQRPLLKSTLHLKQQHWGYGTPCATLSLTSCWSEEGKSACMCEKIKA